MDRGEQESEQTSRRKVERAVATSTNHDELLLRFDEPAGSRAVVLDDDGRVALAYLLNGEDIVGDVWSRAPEAVDWKDRSQVPFLNPRSLCASEDVPRLSRHSSVRCAWFENGVEVTDGTLMARLEHGAKPGWSRLALRAGPLAKPLRKPTGHVP